MKKQLLSLVAIFMIAGISNNLMAQETASASASATIVAPITITYVDDLEFGNLAVQNATGGTVVMAPAGTRTRTAGVTLPGTTGTFNAAEFTVGGTTGYTYTITLPSTDYTITRVSGSETMIVNAFTSSPTGTGTLGGSETLTVGATLNVSANQAPGTYTNATKFDVTVNYN